MKVFYDNGGFGKLVKPYHDLKQDYILVSQEELDSYVDDWKSKMIIDKAKPSEDFKSGKEKIFFRGKLLKVT